MVEWDPLTRSVSFDYVRSEKSDAVNIIGQLEGILAHNLYCIDTIGFKDACGSGCYNILLMQKDSYLADSLLISLGRSDFARSLWPDALDFR
jgi:hypothetical protein